MRCCIVHSLFVVAVVVCYHAVRLVGLFAADVVGAMIRRSVGSTLLHVAILGYLLLELANTIVGFHWVRALVSVVRA